MVEYIRYSILKDYLTCPLLYKKKWILKEETYYPEAVYRGSHIHKAISLWIEGHHDTCEQELKTEEEREIFMRAKEILEQVPITDLVDHKILTEYSFNEILEGIGETHGRLDIVLIQVNTVRIIDIKTGWHAGKDAILQATIYTKAAQKIWNDKDINFAFWLPRTQEIYDTEKLLDWSYIIQVVKEMRDDTEFVPKPIYKSCSTCPYGDTCTARRRKHDKGFSKTW